MTTSTRRFKIEQAYATLSFRNRMNILPPLVLYYLFFSASVSHWFCFHCFRWLCFLVRTEVWLTPKCFCVSKTDQCVVYVVHYQTLVGWTEPWCRHSIEVGGATSCHLLWFFRIWLPYSSLLKQHWGLGKHNQMSPDTSLGMFVLKLVCPLSTTKWAVKSTPSCGWKGFVVQEWQSLCFFFVCFFI